MIAPFHYIFVPGLYILFATYAEEIQELSVTDTVFRRHIPW